MRESGAVAHSLTVYEQAATLARRPAQLCRAWIGQAAGLRIQDHHVEALQLLTQAQQAACSDQSAELQMQVHYHRAGVYFALGHDSLCLQETESAHAQACLSSDSLLMVRALSTLGDAHFQRGHLHTAEGYYNRCVRLCRTNGHARLEAINLGLRGFMRFYQGRLYAATKDLLRARRLANQMNDRRAEVVSGINLGIVYLHEGRFKQACQIALRGAAIAQELGSRRFEAGHKTVLGAALARLGQIDVAEEELEAAYAISQRYGPAQMGPWTLSELAGVTRVAEKRDWALHEGERLLALGSVAHNHLLFRKRASEIALSLRDWRLLNHHLQALVDYTTDEPLPWVEQHLEQMRALTWRYATEQQRDYIHDTQQTRRGT